MSEKDNEKEKPHNPSSSGGLVVSDQEQDLAQTALADFTKGNYTSCIANLSKLEATWTHDSKVTHNKAVSEFYKSELKKTDQFRKNLNALSVPPHVNSDEITGLDDVEQCAVYYNHAVVLFHLKQFNLALKIMKKIFTFIEPMEESLAHKVCLLLIELHLCMRQVEPALQDMVYIRTQFASTKNIQVLEKEPAEEKPVVFDDATDAFRIKLRQYQTRCYLMHNALKASKRELKNLMSTGGFSFSSIFLKANLEYLKRNFVKSIKVLNSILGNNLPAFKDTGESINVLYFNNMGCIHHYMGKANLACYYFQKALQENDDCMKSFGKPEASEPVSNRPLYTLGSNKKAELMYNLGVSLLYAGKPLNAFDCLTEAVQVFHMNPRLWLRLSECCIMANKSGNEHDFNIHVRKNDLVQSIIGSSLHRKIILTSHLSRESQYNHESQSYAIPSASLEFASLCLKNVLHLLPPEEEGERFDGWKTPPYVPDSKSAKTSGIYAAPSNPIDEVEVQNLRCSALAASAYVNLCIGDYIISLEHAQQLLGESSISGVHKLLGHLYAAEALIAMNKISEAIEHLSPDLISEFNMSVRASSPDSEQPTKPLKDWYPNNLLTAKALLQYHLAVAFAIRGEFDKAGETLKHVWNLKGTCDVPIQVVMLAVYIELQLGHAENSRTIIKQHCPQYR